MNTLRFWLGASVVVAAVILPERSSAQCHEWSSGFGDPGLNADVFSLVSYDDGFGAALYAAGDFTSAGNLNANHIAKWNGSTWEPLGRGLSGNYGARCMVSYDDGSGAALYAGGFFSKAGTVTVGQIAKWDGASWSAVGRGVTGVGSNILALAVFDDGAGQALYAGGSFVGAGSVSASNIARWNGSSWAALGTGANQTVHALTVFDDGSGPALYAGGSFTFIGGVVANHVAKWNGTHWSTLGVGTNNSTVNAMTVFDDGSGPALYVAGDFTTAGGVSAIRVAKWNGSNWSPLGSGITGAIIPTVFSLEAYDDGAGAALYAGGDFDTAGGVTAHNIARWNGTSWSALVNEPERFVHSLAVHDAGSGPALYAGGTFTAAGHTAASRVARWDGSNWSALGRGNGMNEEVRALSVFDDGTGPAVYAGGSFTTAGSSQANYIAKWDGQRWTEVGRGTSGIPYDPSVFALLPWNDGTGPALYVAGGFIMAGNVVANGVAKWDGSTWHPLGKGLVSQNGGSVLALATFDDGSGPALFAAGDFVLPGQSSSFDIAKWDGVSWSALGSGLNLPAWSLAVFDDGSGPALFAGGDFNTAGGVSANGVAKWNGVNWASVATGAASASVHALVSFDDGSGPALFAGGEFFSLGGPNTINIAKWNGTTWSALEIGTNAIVHALAVFDDGAGPELVASGEFTRAGGIRADGVAAWNGSHWSSLDGGIDAMSFAGVRALTVSADPSNHAQALYAGGFFTKAGGRPAMDIAKWLGCPHR